MKFTLSTLTQLVADKPDWAAEWRHGMPSKKLLNQALKYSRVFASPIDGKPVVMPVVQMLKWLKAVKLIEDKFNSDTFFFLGWRRPRYCPAPRGRRQARRRGYQLCSL